MAGAESISDALESHAASRPDAVALDLGDVRMTFAEIVEDASRVASWLTQNGAREGSVVFATTTDRAQQLVAICAAFRLGATCALQSPDPGVANVPGAVTLTSALQRAAVTTSAVHPPRVAVRGDDIALVVPEIVLGMSRGRVVPHRTLTGLLDSLAREVEVPAGATVLSVESTPSSSSSWSTTFSFSRSERG